MIQRRFTRSLQNLFQLYLPLAHDWACLQNAEDHPLLVAFQREGDPRIVLESERWSRLEELSRG